MSTLSPHDQRHVDRAARARRLIPLAIKEAGGLDGAMDLESLARLLTALGLEADANDVQVWCAMLRIEGKITVVGHEGPVRYALAQEGTS